ncbi:hypothetical protein DFQ27_007206 [Actinomortierella ambigua]|uniref:Zinc finger CHCC-type domain-containing protein n=1 Tax=Actinomortierella ambigua TaxID=1343610 RepID=A0A9P6PVJ0_9FUNG|nr:hypothetical protein DFQ27_007206 [Actinomortierella ambigua]
MLATKCIRPLARLGASNVRALSTSNLVLNRSNLQQASNRETTWSPNQQPKTEAMKGPRFENTDIAAQPNSKAAIELIAEEPIRMVEGRRARCDGGGGSLGHPAVWINLDQPGDHACGYCGIRFEQKPHHH